MFLYEHDARREAQPLLQCHIKITDYVKLDNGSAHLGFCQETANLANVAMIENWSFESKLKSNQNDPWSGLSMDYKCDWPK